jgi:kynureninase
MDRNDALQRDATDQLAGLRERFVIPADEPIYLLGNSLGRQPAGTAARLAEGLGTWARSGVASWHEHGWMDLPSEVGDRLGAALLGARPGEVVLADNTTVNLYKCAAAAVEARPGRSAIVTDAGNFPTDLYVLQGVARRYGLELRVIESDPVGGPDPAALAPALGDDVALLSLPLVAFRSGALADLAAITAEAHVAGALVCWDVSHAVGAVPIDLTSAAVDLAVGCTYKYVNGGPGSPAFLYVRTELQAELAQPVQGWFGQRDQFLMGPAYDPAPDVRRFLTGTPNVLGLLAVDEGVAVLAEGGMERLRAKGIALGEYAVDLFDAWLAPLGVRLGGPRDAARRGGHLALRHPAAGTLVDDLYQRAGVHVDHRPPDVLRYAFAPAYTRFVDVWDALDRTRALIAGDGDW